MRASYYARALHAALIEHPEKESELLTHFAHTIEVNGHTHMLSKILRAYSKLVAKDDHARTIEVKSASPLTEEEVQHILKKEPYKQALSSLHKKVVRSVDASLVGGIIVRTGNTRIDGSYKRALLDLYQEVTK